MSDSNQQQTREAFSFKWGEKRNTYDSPETHKFHVQWSIDRYFGTAEKMEEFMAWCANKKMMDAGCGNGFTSSVVWNKHLNGMDYLGVDIADDAVATAEKRFNESELKGRFKADNIQTMQLGEKFDVILSSGVILHTSDPRATFDNLVQHLNPGGKIVFYVYKKKAPMREFADDLIRERMQPMSDEEAWEAMKPLSELGMKLGELNAEIELENNIDLLEIPAGKHNVQRLFYWYFMKAFYRPEYSMDEMNHINFDW